METGTGVKPVFSGLQAPARIVLPPVKEIDPDVRLVHAFRGRFISYGSFPFLAVRENAWPKYQLRPCLFPQYQGRTLHPRQAGVL